MDVKIFNSDQIEKDVLTTSILQKTYLNQLLECDKEIFFYDKNRKIFEAIIELNRLGESIDFSVISAYFSRIKSNVDQEYIVSLMTNAQTTYNFKYHLQALSDNMYKRKLMTSAEKLFSSVKENNVSFNVFVDQILEIYSKMNNISNDDYCNIADLCEKDIKEIFKTDNYLSTGLYSIDQTLIGLFKGQIIVVAGQPGAGKSTLVFQMLCNIGNCAFISLEMKRDALYAKLLSRFSDVDSSIIESGNISEHHLHKIEKAKEKIKDKIKLKVFDTSLTFVEIISAIKKMKEQEDIRAVAIDYLQIVQGAPGMNDNERLSNMSRAFKNLAFELNIPIILLSQLTKESYKESRAPNLSDLRGSGAICQEADVVLLLYHIEEDGVQQFNVAAAKVKKGRIGRIADNAGNSFLVFEKEFSRFKCIEQDLSRKLFLCK